MIIIKGGARADGEQLGRYLLDKGDNDRTTLVDMLGMAGRSLPHALEMAEAAASRTKGKKPLWHAQINPAEDVRLTREQQLMAVTVLERHLGFEDLPRAIVSHLKDGREHLHVVWTRYDAETGTLRRDDFTHRKNVAAAAEIATRLGLEPNRSPFLDQDRIELTRDERRQETRAGHTQADRQQEKRAHKTRAERKTEISAMWHDTATGHDLRERLDAAGYTLARGWRGFVVVDERGEPPMPEADRRTAGPADGKRDARPDRARHGGEEDKQGDDPPKTAGDILVELTRHHSTFTRQDLARAVDKATGGGGHQPWMMQAGGLDAMTPDTKASAERSYADWVGRNPEFAERFGIVRYVSYVQTQQAKQDAADPEAARARQESKAAFDRLMAEIDTLPELVRLGPDEQDRDRFTSRATLETELRMQGAAADLAQRAGHAVPDRVRDAVPGLDELGDQQRAAFEYLTESGDLALVVGFAGTGKSKMLGLAREAWEASGYRVRGAALSGIAAEGLQNSAGIESRTLHSLLHQLDGIEGQEAELARLDAQLAGWPSTAGLTKRQARAQDREHAYLAAKRDGLATDLVGVRLTERDVIVLDEAGMVGSGLMERLLSAANEAGAKIVMTGDHEQLQAVDAGAAFRAVRDAHGAREITEVRRQKEDWQRQATEAFGRTRTGDALRAYHEAGMSHQAETRDQAKEEIVSAWTEARREKPEGSQIILAYTRQDVAELNDMARAAYREEGRLGEDTTLETAGGRKAFATGDRLYFTKNDRRLQVKNGTLGDIQKIEDGRVTVGLDGGRSVAFDIADYGHITHGYAATVHKSQGVTVERAHVLASRYMDRHAAYVGMTRHTDRADLYYGAEEFKTWDKVEARLSRDGRKDTTLDYVARAAAEGTATDDLRTAVREFHAEHRPDVAAPSWTVPPAPAATEAPVPAPADVEPPAPEAKRPLSRAECLAEIARSRREQSQPAQATESRAERFEKRMSDEQKAKLDEIRQRTEAMEELRRQLKLNRGQRGPSL